MSFRQIRFVRASLAILITTTALTVAIAPAQAADAPGWEVESHSYPTNMTPGANAVIGVEVYNIGGAPTSEGGVLLDTLPAGVRGVSGRGWTCTDAVPDVCSSDVLPIKSGASEEYLLNVSVEGNALPGPAINTVVVSGGASSGANSSDELTIGTLPSGFGLTTVNGWSANADGSIDTQAGTHPFATTFNFFLNNRLNSRGALGGEALPEEEMRHIVVNLPQGMVGSPTAFPQCTREAFDNERCPAGSQIGVVYGFLANVVTKNEHLLRLTFALYNLVPPPGRPAEFAFTLFGNQTFLDASVRSDGDYGITENVSNVVERGIVGASVTVWGVPGDSAHDPLRECGCGLAGAGHAPLLTLSTACEGPQTFSASVSPWLNESETDELTFATHNQRGVPVGLSGCDHLSFAPTLSIAPDTSYADTPTGPVVELKTPQEGLATQEGLAAANLKDTKVTLPEGMVINPGQATGLGVCTAAEDGIGTTGPPNCPNASIVGTDEIETPLLAHALKGNVYVLDSNPPDLKLLVAASGEGVNIKLVGDVRLDEATGRLTAIFDETPELPFTIFRLAFSGGARAALTTPTGCGTFSSASDFTPWSAPFEPDALSSSSFVIDHGTGGGACPGGELPFSPSLTAGSTTDQAGGYTDFSLLLTRGDDQQRIRGLQFKAPPGLTGNLASVPLCTNAEAEANACPAASQIGHTSVESGAGPYPLVVPEPGQPQAPIYLTEGYEGAPFGLSIVVPLHVGPFTLPTQRVRAKIEVDPNTAQLTITTDPLPQVVSGVPTNLRAVDSVIDHPGFMINPTNCEPQSFSGTAYGAPAPGAGGSGTSAPIATHFQMGACRALQFAPKFTVSTSGKTSRANGASLRVKLAYPNVPRGTQANVRSVHVELPKALPSRLSTLNHACLDSVFNRNPASCPSQSRVGFAKAVTPVLPVPLEGPAYFVSHGGQRFPELIVVLQGYGVTVDLEGETFISKAGITSTTFKSVPDVPVGSFELTLPEGPFSALAANADLCSARLTLPTTFHAQNGAVLSQKTAIDVQGCPYALRIVHRSVEKRTLTLQVSVPAAGRLVASGNGVSKAVKTAKGHSTLTLTLKEDQAGKLRTKMLLRFTPANGKQRKVLRKNITVTFR